MARIFISYSRVDKPFVEKLYIQLESVYGSGSVWYDKDILGGEDFWNRICGEIDKADVFLYLLSPESIASTWCNAEYDEADRLNKAIIPIIVRDRTPLIPKVQHLNVLDMSSGAENTVNLNKLYQSINPIFYSKPSEQQPPKNLTDTPYPGERQNMLAVPDHGQNFNSQQIAIQGNGNQSIQNIATGIDGRWLAIIILIVVVGFVVIFIFSRKDQNSNVTLANEFPVETPSSQITQHLTATPTLTTIISETPSPTINHEQTNTPSSTQKSATLTNEIQEITSIKPSKDVDKTICSANIINTTPQVDICRISQMPGASSNNTCILSGTSIVILGSTKDSNGFTWYEIDLEENPDHSEGWINENDVDNIVCR